MTRNKGEENTLDAFNGASTTDETDYIYGDGELAPPPSALPTMARQISIMKIRPDITQPRRAIPLGIRGGWDGSPDEIEHLLRLWRTRAEREIQIDVMEMLEEDTETYDVDEGEEVLSALLDHVSATTLAFYKLVQLAADIHRVGLTQPITVAREGKGYVIIAGERRYLAHHLLKMWLGEPETISTFVREKRDVWAQASENTNRDSLNPIGMARQIAILIMAMYEEVEGAEFESFQELVEPGESDRAYYAQVENGYKYRIKNGYPQKLLNATGLQSNSSLRDYRSLLRLPDEVWVQADIDNWSLRQIREETRSTERSVDASTLLDDESFEQPPIPPRQYPDDTWDDGQETPPPDDEVVVPAGQYTMPPREVPADPSLRPWLDGQAFGLLDHLREIQELYQDEDVYSEVDFSDLTAAILWFKNRTSRDAPTNDREMLKFEKMTNYYLHKFELIQHIIIGELNEIAQYVVNRARTEVERK